MEIFTRLSCHVLRAEVPTIRCFKKNQMTSEIKFLARAKVYFSFNSEGYNFIVTLPNTNTSHLKEILGRTYAHYFVTILNTD